jgi:lysyl-tRNA synthetase class 2
MPNELNDQMLARRQKLEKLQSLGINPYPYSYDVNTSSAEVLANPAAWAPEANQPARIAGRIVALRSSGKASFGHCKDGSGRIQFYIRLDTVGPEAYEAFKCLDLGDWIGVEGPAFTTRTGELTIEVKKMTVLAKSLRPLPVPKQKTDEQGNTVVFDEFTDVELRYRQRHLDLTLNDRVLRTFRLRTAIISTIRQYLNDQRFLEVETPTLQPIYGGASARPFSTHHNALNLDLYLRISNELYLKRLIVGGLERVYEFVKDFRNEGIDRTHNPEFTQVEFYQAYADYQTMMEHFENIYYQTALKVLGRPVIMYQGQEINLTPPWKRLTLAGAVKLYGPVDLETISDEEIRQLMAKNHWKLDGAYSRGRAQARLFEELCERHLIQPTFIYDFPRETTPLCKPHRRNPELVERFEPYINGWEVGNAYSELTDPILQRRLLEDQVERGRGGEEETHPLDEEFIQALECGMPPTGGVGIGIDRMVMLLTDSPTIRDVILFPLLKP